MKYHPLLNGFRRRKRNGKIARLPEATRERINHMLRDGVRYRDIIRALTQDAEPPLPYAINEMNLSNWYRGGHQEWCRHQEQLKLDRKFPLPMVGSGRGADRPAPKTGISPNLTCPCQI